MAVEGERNQGQHLECRLQAGGCVAMSSKLGETEEGAGVMGRARVLSSRGPLRGGGQGV